MEYRHLFIIVWRDAAQQVCAVSETMYTSKERAVDEIQFYKSQLPWKPSIQLVSPHALHPSAKLVASRGCDY